MKVVWLKYLLASGLLWAFCATAQVVHQVTPTDSSAGSYVTFKFDWDQGRPWLQYSIAVDDAGNTHFEGVGNPIESGDSDTFSQDFVMTDANRQKIFELAGKLDYSRKLRGQTKKHCQDGPKDAGLPRSKRRRRPADIPLLHL